MLASTEARSLSPLAARSTINRVVAPVRAPRARPCAARPASNHTGPDASRKQHEPSAAESRPARSTVRGPSASEAGPNSNNAGALTSAKVA
nr:hypothetical protein [Actinopolyspora erythraea]